MTLKAQLADRKNNFPVAMPSGKAFAFAMPAMPATPVMPAMPDMDVPVSIVVVHSSARSGLMVENLTPQLGDFFGAKDGQGVLVRSVEKGSLAEKAGFRAGDVIVKVNGESISDSGDFTHALHGRKNTALNVSIIREKKEQNLRLPLPERNQSEVLDEIDLTGLQSEIAGIGPEMKTTLVRIKPEIERATEDIRSHQRELKKQMRDLERELRNEEIQMEKPKKQNLKTWQPPADI
jgi:membrane-associated protease RseP (regulator of RpoE activity)